MTGTGAVADVEAAERVGRAVLADPAQRAGLAADLARRYAAGETREELAKSTGHAPTTVELLLVEAGLVVRSNSEGHQRLRGQRRREMAAALRRRYEQDPGLSVAALAATVPYSRSTVRRLLLDAGTVLRIGRGPARCYTEEDLRWTGIGLRHLYLTGSSLDELARIIDRSRTIAGRALIAAGVPLRTQPPHRRITEEETAALGALLGPAHLEGATPRELAQRIRQPEHLIRQALTAAGYPVDSPGVPHHQGLAAEPRSDER